MLEGADRTDELERRLRASLARELHDGVLRDLTDCVVQLEVLRAWGRAGGPELGVTGTDEYPSFARFLRLSQTA